MFHSPSEAGPPLCVSVRLQLLGAGAQSCSHFLNLSNIYIFFWGGGQINIGSFKRVIEARLRKCSVSINGMYVGFELSAGQMGVEVKRIRRCRWPCKTECAPNVE